MEPGIYTLVLRLDEKQEVRVGSLGVILFPAGYYAYTGSARGPGGLKRVERHLEVLWGARRTQRWHIDYLLPFTSLEEAFITPTREDLECVIARRIEEVVLSIPSFGCTDCDCVSHLHYSAEKGELFCAVRRAHGHG
jgi:endonuclease-3